MLACISLVVLVSLPEFTGEVNHEWHNHTFCQPGSILTEEVIPGIRFTSCEIAANEYIEQLQHAGILPGSRSVISYKATCTTGV